MHYILFRFMESIDWCTGTNIKGYMMHLTAQKLLKYGYIKADRFDSVCSLAIVRNPFSRMVSVYMYNRYGPLESFPTFMKRWHHMLHHYRERGEMEEYYTPCHLIPQFEYTHFEGKQLVQSVVKQEELKYLKTTDEAQKAIAAGSTVGDLPDTVRNALLGMPHTNRRDSGKKWFEYFDQETLNMTYEMYKKDFHIFDYPPSISQRPDLKPAEGSAVADETGLEPARRCSAFRLPYLLSASLPPTPQARSSPFNLSPLNSQHPSRLRRVSIGGQRAAEVLRQASAKLETVKSGLELSALSASNGASPGSTKTGAKSPGVQTPDIHESELDNVEGSQMTVDRIDEGGVVLGLLEVDADARGPATPPSESHDA